MKKLITILSLSTAVMCGCIDSTRGEVSLAKYNGMMVVDKKLMREINDGSINAWWVYLEKDKEIKIIRTVKYWFDKYNIGDTVNEPEPRMDVIYLDSHIDSLKYSRETLLQSFRLGWAKGFAHNKPNMSSIDLINQLALDSIQFEKIIPK